MTELEEGNRGDGYPLPPSPTEQAESALEWIVAAASCRIRGVGAMASSESYSGGSGRPSSSTPPPDEPPPSLWRWLLNRLWGVVPKRPREEQRQQAEDAEGQAAKRRRIYLEEGASNDSRDAPPRNYFPVQQEAGEVPSGEEKEEDRAGRRPKLLLAGGSAVQRRDGQRLERRSSPAKEERRLEEGRHLEGRHRGEGSNPLDGSTRRSIDVDAVGGVEEEAGLARERDQNSPGKSEGAGEITPDIAGCGEAGDVDFSRSLDGGEDNDERMDNASAAGLAAVDVWLADVPSASVGDTAEAFAGGAASAGEGTPGEVVVPGAVGGENSSKPEEERNAEEGYEAQRDQNIEPSKERLVRLGLLPEHPERSDHSDGGSSKTASPPSLPAGTAAPATVPAQRRSKRLCLDEGGRANVEGGANPSSTQQIPTRDQCGGDALDGGDARGGDACGGDETKSGADVEGEPGANDADGSDHSDDGNSKKGSGKAPLHADSARDAPEKVATEEEVVQRMRRLLHVEEKVEAANSDEEKQFYREVEAFFVEAARSAFRDGTYDSIFVDLGRLVSKCGPGLYALLYKLGVPLKVGMSSVDRKVRADQQNYKVAYDLCNMEKLNELCPADSDAVKGIMGLGPPSLVFHPDKHHKAIEIVLQQVGEALINSFYETSTGTVGERIMMWPSERIQQITTLRSADYFTADDRAFLDGALFEFFQTWSTYKSDLAKRREAEEVLFRLLPESPEDRFLTLHMLRRAFGRELVQEFANAIEDSVRSEQMEELIGQLKVILGDAKEHLDDEGIDSLPIETVHDVRDIIGSIDKDSDDYDHYKPPELERLAEAAAPKLRTFIENSTNKTVIVWERHMFDAVEQYEKEAFCELIPHDSERVEVIRGTDHLLRITCKMPDGKVVRHLISRSYYRIFAEETSKEVRISVTDAYVGLLSYLCAGGVITREHAEQEALVLRSFLMEWEGLDGDIDGEVKGSVRAARNHAVGEGMCVGGIPRNLKTVSQLLQIGYQETADVRSSLGRELFDILVTCFDVPAGPNNPTPLEAGFRCGGVIGVGHLLARECRYKHLGDNEQPSFGLVGKRKEDFLLPAFKCECCCDSTYPREVEFICQRIKSLGDQSVTSAQMQRALACPKGRASIERIAAEKQWLAAEKQRLAAKEPEREYQRKYRAEKKRNQNEILQMEDEEAKEHFERTGFSFGLASAVGFPAGWSAKKNYKKIVDPDGNTHYGLTAARKALKQRK